MAGKLSIMDSSSATSVPQADIFISLLQKAIDNYKSVISTVKSSASRSWDKSIQPLEEATENLDRVWNALEHQNAVMNSAKIRSVYEELLPKLTDFRTDLMQDEDLYHIYKEIYDSTEYTDLDIAQKTIISNELRDFKLSGVSLEPAQRVVYKSLVQRLSALENEFSNNELDATEGWSYYVAPEKKDLLTGLPEYTLEQAKTLAAEAQKPGWLLNLDHACYYAVVSQSDNRDLRKEFYTAYSTRASDQGPTAGKWDNTLIINEILKIRQEIAALVGYHNYAEYSLVSKMATSVEQVKNFILDLASKTKSKAQREYKELCDYAESQHMTAQLEIWDLAYYSEMFKKQNYDISDEELRVYFPEPRVLSGLFKLMHKLYNITIEEVFDFEKWHDSVRMFKVLDKENELRGHFYIDLYAREGKRGGAWQSDCLCRIRFGNGELQKPIAYLNCNFAPPTASAPGLLTHSDVITLFHEFGHTLHHILTQINYYSVSGINGVEWDAVELPSQFMENWCWEWSVIQDITENINTGESLPREIFDKLLATKNYQSALDLMRQLELAFFDLRIHANEKDDVALNAQQILDAVRNEIAVIPIPKFNRFQNSFGHIFAGGYAAGYYSYKWAEVLSCDAFEKFSKSGLFNPEIGMAFLTKILEQGGSKPAMDLFVAFAGHKPEVDALLRHHGIVE
jgi:oligopeptidase A